MTDTPIATRINTMNFVEIQCWLDFLIVNIQQNKSIDFITRNKYQQLCKIFTDELSKRIKEMTDLLENTKISNDASN